MAEEHRIAGLDAVDPEAIVALWTGEAELDEEEARRRLSEVLFVGLGADGELGGVCTAYLAEHPQLGCPMWHFRTFVAEAHRRSALALTFARRGRDELERRYADGEDRRAPGVVYEIENRELQRHFPQADWHYVDFLFVGVNAYGDHVRVHYFPGAPAPPPPGA